MLDRETRAVSRPAFENPLPPATGGYRILSAAGLQWRLRELGKGPALFLLHGTGASIHSWNLLAPLLARSLRVVMIDLPGHGQTSLPPRLAIEDMAQAIGALLVEMRLRPEIVIGHSAGAAVLAQMCLDGRLAPRAIVSLNGALLPFGGAASHVFGPFARLLAVAPMVPSLVSRRLASRDAVARLVARLGSTIPAGQIDAYVELLHSHRHISAALRMMANWDLHAFSRRLPALAIPLELVVCDGDRAVPASQADQVARLLPGARVHRLSALGHLGHEEDPQRVGELILSLARDAGLDL